MTFIEKLSNGLRYAKSDFSKLSSLDHHDVKPKEDQVKCALYRALSEEGYLVHVEAACARNGERCDLFAVALDGHRAAIEIKSAWGGVGWVNKPLEQSATWKADIEKLLALQENENADSGYFVLCLAYQFESRWESVLKNEVQNIGGKQVLDFEISEWNGLDRISFYIKKVF
jgi:hypothetical protein